MNLEMLNILDNEYIGLILIPILVGLLQAIKQAAFINDKFVPIISIVLGVVLGIVFTGFEIKEGIIAGLFIGLSAVGLFSGSTNVSEGIRKK